jgi:hypothetical protein
VQLINDSGGIANAVQFKTRQPAVLRTKNVGEGMSFLPLPRAAQSIHPSSAGVMVVGQNTKPVQRRFLRVKLPKGMLVAWQHTGGRAVSRVATLGLGGLFITTSEPPSVGALVKIVFDVPGGEVRARAIVKNVKTGQGMAIAFIEMGYSDRARLERLLKKLI